MTIREFKTYNPGAVFYCKDRRLLVYLGRDSFDNYIFVWVGCMMAILVDEDKAEYIEKEFELSILEKRIDYLHKNQKLKDLVLSYRGLPNLIECLGTLKNSIIDNLISSYSRKLKTIEKPKLQLKRGYLYDVRGAIYLYLGYQKIQITKSYYCYNKDVRKVHLYMFVTEDELDDLEKNLRHRISLGYDASFRMNFKKSDLTEIGLGLREIPISEERILRL